MVLPILAKTITSALVKKGSNAKKESKKVSAEKLLPGSVGNKVKVSKFKSRTPRTYRKKFEPTKFLPPSKIDENFDMAKLDDLLASLVDNTKDLEKITKKDVDDEKKKNTQKKNAKEKLKRSKREEETEEKKAVIKVKSSPMKFKAPDFFKDILAMGGRLVLATGIMTLLNFLTDPEKKDGLIQFLTDHMDKIIVGTLGALAVAIGTSLLPMFGMLSSFMLMVKPILIGLGGLLLNPMTWAFIGMGYAAAKQGLSRGEKEVVAELEEQVGGSEDPYLVFSEDNRKKLIQKYEDYRKDYKENPFKYPLITARNLTGEVDREIDERIRFLETGKFGYGEFSFNIGDFSYSTGGEFDFDTGQSSGGFKFKPQTEVVPGVKLGGLKGDSGSVAYEGQERASLSIQYSPFAQSDIDEQGMSIISGKGYRRSTDSNHKGFDIPAIDGTPVYAYLPGEITQNRYARGYGNIVEWKDSKYGQTHMFAHLKEPGPLSVGDKFEAGTMLARTGDTGTPGSYHLHWEIGAQGSEVDPGEWVKKHPINFSSTPKDQNVSYQAPYERSGTQIAMVQVPTPVPVPTGGVTGSRGFTGGSSGSVNIYEDLVLTTHYREA